MMRRSCTPGHTLRWLESSQGHIIKVVDEASRRESVVRLASSLLMTFCVSIIVSCTNTFLSTDMRRNKVVAKPTRQNYKARYRYCIVSLQLGLHELEDGAEGEIRATKISSIFSSLLMRASILSILACKLSECCVNNLFSCASVSAEKCVICFSSASNLLLSVASTSSSVWGSGGTGSETRACLT